MDDSNEDDFSITRSWPGFEIQWDLDPKNFYWCLDSKGAYLSQFPDGALLGEADLNEIIENLTYNSNAPIGKTDNDYS